jgi:predicted RNase H-like HicB family nuclease
MVAAMKPRYTAEAERSGGWWSITVAELPGVFSQARRLDQVEYMAREAISLLLEVPSDSFDVDVVENLDPPTQEAMADIIAAREAVATLKRSTTTKTRDFVQSLHESGYPQRDIGRLMGISHQRVAQLLAESGRSKAQPAD